MTSLRSRLAQKQRDGWKGAGMSAEENKAITRRINDEAWTNGNVDVIDELAADEYVHTVVGAPEPNSAALRGSASW